ncbi:MAG: polysaccharide biosynthesis tyrosine autokinase, partial [Acutalibacteraceae bacterium]
MEQERFEAMPHNIYEDGSSVDIVRLVKSIVSKLWAVLIVGIIFAAGGYIISESTYVEQYSAEATLAFMKTSYVKVTDYTDTGDAETVVKEERTFYANSDVKRYQFLLRGNAMVAKIKKALDAQGLSTVYSESFIENSLNVSTVDDDLTGFFVISVTSTDGGYCDRALKIVIEEFPGYVQGYDNTLSIDVVKEPSAPHVSNSAGSVANAMYGFIIGAALVVVIIFFTVLVTDTVMDMDELKTMTGTKVLGSIPIIEKPTGLFMKKKVPTGALLITDEKKVTFSFVESFKAIRTKLESIYAERGYKCFVVTSTYEDEGKTTVSVNMACALAQKGKSVLLIDCDFRKPAVLRAVGVKSDTRYGLIPIIKGTSTYVDSVKFIKSLGIFVLPTGGISQKSTEVLDADKVRSIIDQARKEFDYIIIASPPAHVVTDSLVIAPLSDGIIYCV